MSDGMKNTPQRKVVKTHDAYPLRTVAAMTGLTPDLIRAWEKRYAVVAPVRGARGRAALHGGRHCASAAAGSRGGCGESDWRCRRLASSGVGEARGAERPTGRGWEPANAPTA